MNRRSFYARLPGIFAYPLKGPGKWIIAGWAVLWLVSELLSYLPLVGLLFVFLRLFVWFALMGYLCAYMLKLLVSSAAGDAAPPDWPDFGNFWDDILRPAFLVIGTVAAAFLPAWAYLLAGLRSSSPLTPAEETCLVGALLVLGALYLPMALLSVAMEDNLRGLNPVRIVASIPKVFVPYLLTCGLLVVLVLGGFAVESIPAIPFVSLVLSQTISIYLVMVEMRLIGLLYHAYRFRLNWYDETTDRYAAR